MLAIQVKKYGSAEELYLGEYPDPVLSAHDLLVQVKAAGLNRADILQRQGEYPPPSGASEILGLEMAGVVVRVGAAVTAFQEGDPVFGLIPGGGYAEYAVVSELMVRRVIKGMSFVEAAAIPEAFLTAYQSLNWLGKLREEETVLLHAGASGVGTSGIQLAKVMGARVAVSASEQKYALCIGLGADWAFDYKKLEFWSDIKEATGGVDVIVDPIGGPYFSFNLDLLKRDGRMIMLAAMGGVKALDINVGQIIFKRLQIMGSTLRSRTLDYQAQLMESFCTFAFPYFEEGLLKPSVDVVFDWKDVQEAHRYMEENRNIGKVVLQVG